MEYRALFFLPYIHTLWRDEEEDCEQGDEPLDVNCEKEFSILGLD